MGQKAHINPKAMKKNLPGLLLAMGCMIAAPSASQAQLLKRIQQKVEQKLEDAADKTVDGILDSGNKTAGTPTSGPNQAAAPVREDYVYDFVPGKSVIFEDNMGTDPVGRMPKYWRTHSTGSVATVNGVPGKWLKVEQNASYQLDTLLQLPQRFTLEFEILTRSAAAGDLRDMHFGFSKNPVPKNFIYGTASSELVVSTALDFIYNTVNTSSYDTQVSNRVEFPLDNLGNTRIPVAIEVNGTHMRVFVNQRSVLDAEAVTPESPKYFYFSNENQRDGAQVYIGNIRIAQ